MQASGQSLWRERELLEYRRERIELLLSDGIVSPEMEIQLTQTLTALERELESFNARPIAPAHRLAA